MSDAHLRKIERRLVATGTDDEHELERLDRELERAGRETLRQGLARRLVSALLYRAANLPIAIIINEMVYPCAPGGKTTPETVTYATVTPTSTRDRPLVEMWAFALHPADTVVLLYPDGSRVSHRDFAHS